MRPREAQVSARGTRKEWPLEGCCLLRVVVVAGLPLCALALQCTAPFEAAEPTEGRERVVLTAQDAAADAGDPTDAGDESGATSVPTWAEWPMPNSPVDVETGAPNRERYRDDCDGTVTDLVTGLMWQRLGSADGGAFDAFLWASATGAPIAGAYCANLDLAGRPDWRLPTVIELLSIVDDTVTNPSVDTSYFPDTPSSVFWSATPAAAASLLQSAWGVSFDYGYTGYGDVRSWGFVRCVRGVQTPADAPAGRYAISGSGMVYDTKTRLTWQQAPALSVLTPWTTTTNGTAPDVAARRCSGLSLGGASDWRLPTVRELQTLVDYAQSGTAQDGGPAPMVDTTYFPGTPADVFWSSTPYAGSPGFAWGVDFAVGNSNGYDAKYASYVRCVR
jgi:hypothetical protein